MQLSMFSSAELPASPSASPDSERDWMIRVVGCSGPILPLLAAIGPDGWSGRTSPVSCRSTEDGRLEPCSGGWQDSGMGSPTGFLTLSTSAAGLPGRAFSSWVEPETGEHLRRFSFSPNALRGIRRRLIRGYRSGPRLFSRDLGRWLTTIERLAWWNGGAHVERRRSNGKGR